MISAKSMLLIYHIKLWMCKILITRNHSVKICILAKVLSQLGKKKRLYEMDEEQRNKQTREDSPWKDTDGCCQCKLKQME